MNKILMKLALDAGLINYVDHETPRYYFMNSRAEIEDLEEFFVSVVNECCKAIQTEGSTYEVQSAGEWAANGFIVAVRKHFGVNHE